MIFKITNTLIKRLRAFLWKEVIVEFFNGDIVKVIIIEIDNFLYFRPIETIELHSKNRYKKDFKISWENYPYCFKCLDGYVIYNVKYKIFDIIFYNELEKKLRKGEELTLYWDKPELILITKYLEWFADEDYCDDDKYECEILYGLEAKNYHLVKDIYSEFETKMNKYFTDTIPKFEYLKIYYMEIKKIIYIEQASLNNFVENNRIELFHYNMPYKAELNGVEIYNIYSELNFIKKVIKKEGNSVNAEYKLDKLLYLNKAKRLYEYIISKENSLKETCVHIMKNYDKYRKTETKYFLYLLEVISEITNEQKKVEKIKILLNNRNYRYKRISEMIISLLKYTRLYELKEIRKQEKETVKKLIIKYYNMEISYKELSNGFGIDELEIKSIIEENE